MSHRHASSSSRPRSPALRKRGEINRAVEAGEAVTNGLIVSARSHAARTLTVAGLLATTSAGCTAEYVLRTEHLAAASSLTAQGTPPDRIAVLAAEPNEEPRFLRYNRLKIPPPVPGRSTVRLRTTDSHAQRVAGTTLFVIGLAHLAGLAAHIGYEVVSARSCLPPTCLNEDFSLIFTGPILGTLGFSMLIPGIALMGTGFGAARDVKAGRADFTYLGDPLQIQRQRPPEP